MSIELTITSITEENKREKLHKTSRVLASLLAIPLEVNGECIGAFDKAYKYIRRWKKGENWYYTYPRRHGKTNGKARAEQKHTIAAASPVIDYIKPIEPTEDNIKQEFAKLRKMAKEGRLRVKACGNFPVSINKMSENHLKRTKGHNRQVNIVKERACLLPFVSEILNKTGKLGEVSRRAEGVVYGIVGRIKIGSEIKTIEISLAYDTQSKLFFLSGYEIKKVGNLTAIMGKKSLNQYDSEIYRPTDNIKTVIKKKSLSQFVPTSLISSIADFNNLSTVQKSNPYPDIILDIQHITPSNRYEKFAKALKAAARHLQLPVSIRTERLAQHGEKHFYPIKQELSDYWASLYTNILRELYKNLTEVLGLPAFSHEALRKAFVEAEHPRDEGGRFAEKGITVSETHEEQGLSNKQLKDAVFDYARNHFQGNKYRNKDTNEDIYVTRNGLDEWYSKTKSREQILSLKMLNRLLENAQYDAKTIDNKERRHIVGIKYYSAPCVINNKKYIAKITIRVTSDNKNRYYHHFLQDIQIKPESGMLVQASIQREPPLFSGSTSSIPELKEKASGQLLQKSLFSDAKKKLQALFKKWAGNSLLRYKGRILYSPETGEPLRKKDLDRLLRAIEHILNTATADAGKRMTLDSVAIGKLLQRIASCQKTDYLHALRLDNLSYRGKSYEWIRAEYNHLTDALGKPLSRSEKARYQVCEDTAAQFVKRVNDDIRNGIKESLLTGIREHKSKAEVSQDLFDRFGALNRSWKRIADTETVNTSNLASILEEVHSVPEGEKVYFKRREMAGCCPLCAQADGVIALWSDKPLAHEEIDDPIASVAIWDGKAADGKRGVLVVGALHPHCRGFWVRYGAKTGNAQEAEASGSEDKWNEAVQKVEAEYKAKGVKNPDDGTKGYKERIQEVYQGEKH